MAGVAAVALLLWLIVQWGRVYQTSHGVGHVDIPLDFFVTDADSGQPLQGASIRLHNFDNQSNPIPPYWFELETGLDGHAATVVNLTFYEGRAIPSHELLFYRVAYPHWEMKIEADGYREFEASFANYEEGNSRFHEHSPPPPILIRLRKQQ
jgi:hypothetical protein